MFSFNGMGDPITEETILAMRALEEENARRLEECRLRDPSPVRYELRDFDTMTAAQQDAYTRAPWLRWGPQNRSNRSRNSRARTGEAGKSHDDKKPQESDSDSEDSDGSDTSGDDSDDLMIIDGGGDCSSGDFDSSEQQESHTIPDRRHYRHQQPPGNSARVDRNAETAGSSEDDGVDWFSEPTRFRRLRPRSTGQPMRSTEMSDDESGSVDLSPEASSSYEDDEDTSSSYEDEGGSGDETPRAHASVLGRDDNDSDDDLYSDPRESRSRTPLSRFTDQVPAAERSDLRATPSGLDGEEPVKSPEKWYPEAIEGPNHTSSQTVQNTSNLKHELSSDESDILDPAGKRSKRRKLMRPPKPEPSGDGSVDSDATAKPRRRRKLMRKSM